jgi:hypothetical protein
MIRAETVKNSQSFDSRLLQGKSGAWLFYGIGYNPKLKAAG